MNNSKETVRIKGIWPFQAKYIVYKDAIDNLGRDVSKINLGAVLDGSESGLFFKKSPFTVFANIPVPIETPSQIFQGVSQLEILKGQFRNIDEAVKTAIQELDNRSHGKEN